MDGETAWTSVGWQSLLVVKRLKERRAFSSQVRDNLDGSNCLAALALDREEKSRERERSTGKVPVAVGREERRGEVMAGLGRAQR